MKTSKFLYLLAANSEKELHFHFNKIGSIGTGYHITEVKNVSIQSTDCGGNSHAEKLSIVQLIDGGWAEKGFIDAQKALQIFDRVYTKQEKLVDAEIRFEYGNGEHYTGVYSVDNFDKTHDKLILNLSVPSVACKPKEKIQKLVTIGQSNNCCGSGKSCC